MHMLHPSARIRRYGIIALWALGSSVFLSTAIFIRSNDLRSTQTAGEVRVTILAIGAGSCGVIELPDRRVILVDAGSSSMTDPAGRCIEPFLRSRGIRSIDMLILSHANYDHFGAAFDLLDNYNIKHVCLAPQFVADSHNNPSAKRLLRLLDTTGPPPRFLVAGDRIDLSPVTRIDILWPHPHADLPANESSLVLRLTHAGRSILFTGDIESTAQKHLINDHADLQADVLIAPHHGSFEPTTAAFIKAVNPAQIVSSNARQLTQKQRDFDEIVAVPHFRTHQSGQITLTLAPAGPVTLTPFLSAH